MNERLFQYIWQFQYFNRNDLSVSDGAALQIIHPGKYNTNQGPDFLEATIKIDKTILVGNIELHLNTSDWKKHGHDTDSNYKNVILHVVWQHDELDHPASILCWNCKTVFPVYYCVNTISGCNNHLL